MSGLPRGSLTRELLVRESLRLLDEHGVTGFSLPKLGRALGADPTAIYRHFASKDELILAIADALIEEGLGGLEPSDCWVETLSEIARRARRTSLAHPAAASLTVYRTTQGPAEMRAVDLIIGALHQAGFTGKEAAVPTGRSATSRCSGPGARRRSSPWTSRRSRRTGTRGPAPTWSRTARCTRTSGASARSCPPSRTTRSSRPSCRWCSAGIAARAPRPCACPAHAAAPVN